MKRILFFQEMDHKIMQFKRVATSASDTQKKITSKLHGGVLIATHLSVGLIKVKMMKDVWYHAWMSIKTALMQFFDTQETRLVQLKYLQTKNQE